MYVRMCIYIYIIIYFQEKCNVCVCVINKCNVRISFLPQKKIAFYSARITNSDYPLLCVRPEQIMLTHRPLSRGIICYINAAE